jgi:hypothetical protein
VYNGLGWRFDAELAERPLRGAASDALHRRKKGPLVVIRDTLVVKEDAVAVTGAVLRALRRAWTAYGPFVDDVVRRTSRVSLKK